MFNSKYKLFNLTCLIIGVCFVLGILWLYNGGFVKPKKPNVAINSITTIKKLDELDELPKEVNLPVPFTSQAPEKNWEQPWQDACEEAVALMLDAYYKGYNLSPLFSKDEILKMVEWEDKKGWGYSIEIEKLAELVEHYSSSGVLVKIIENPTIDQIKRILAGGSPVLVVADGKVLPNPHFTNGGPEYHALIIRGYTFDSFITNDPGTQFGENFVYKYKDLMDAIHDWNGGDVKNGRSVVLILE